MINIRRAILYSNSKISKHNDIAFIALKLEVIFRIRSYFLKYEFGKTKKITVKMQHKP